MKRNRLFAVSLAVFILFFISPVFSHVFAEVTSCAENQTIMKLSDIINAHGAPYTNSKYLTNVCYKTIFGLEYTGENSHDCTSSNSNTVLLLADEGVAHVYTYRGGIPVSSFTRVCYGDLNCTSRLICNSNEKEIVSLSAQTNAHLALDTDFYTLKLCCSSPSANITPTEKCPPNTALCEDGTCKANCTFQGCIGTANNLCETGEGCACEDCLGKQDSCVNGAICNETTKLCKCENGKTFNSVSNQCETPISCALGQLICCNVNQTLCVREGVAPFCSSELCEPDEFKCDYDFLCEQNESCQCSDCWGYQDACKSNLICDYKTKKCQQCPGETEFDSNRGTCELDPGILIQIIKPVPGWPFEKFIKDQNIAFEQISSNLKKDLSVNWSFGDGNITNKQNCLTNGNCNTSHAYLSHGTKSITAMAYEQGGEGRAYDFTNVLIYEQGINVFAVITEPPNGESIPSGQSVKFNANNSFVANCTTTQVSCSASALASNASSCYQVGAPVLYCYDFNVSKIGITYDLKFDWTFDKDRPYNSTLNGTWSENYNKVVKFEKSFFFGGNHTAELKVTYGYYI